MRNGQRAWATGELRFGQGIWNGAAAVHYNVVVKQPTDWKGIAYNYATESENPIHSDNVARRYGFRGGLVPGVSVYAYLVHPAVVAWGPDWLERGAASVRLQSPLYDGYAFTVKVKRQGPHKYEGEVIDSEGAACASGEVSLPKLPRQVAPARRRDPPAPAIDGRPPASRATLERLRQEGMGSIRASWPMDGQPDRYLKNVSQMPDLIRLDCAGFANPTFALGLANMALASNTRLGPWIHVESQVQHFAAIPHGSTLVVESRVIELFERKGHEFVDLEVSVYLDPDKPALGIWHRAIYKLRQA